MCLPVIRISFLEMCCVYWIRTGELSKKMAIMKCCHGDPAVIDELIHMGIIEEHGDNVVIKFLDEQLSEFTEIKRIRSEAGKKGGQQGGVRPDEERISGNQFYVIRCTGNGEDFLKIGTTVNSVSRRYSGKMPYEYELVLQILSDRSTDIENSLCDLLANFAYAPKLSFPGQKECYDISFFDEINDIIKSKTGFAIAKLKRNESIRREEKREEEKKEELYLPKVKIQPFDKSDYYNSPSEAFEDIKADEKLIENLVRIVQRSGYTSCTNVTVALAVKNFLTIESAKPDFDGRLKKEVKRHLVNWINKNAKTLHNGVHG